MTPPSPTAGTGPPGRDAAPTPTPTSAGGSGPALSCGICGRPAEWFATVPMCGERPRYPICSECLDPIAWCGYAEDVDLVDEP